MLTRRLMLLTTSGASLFAVAEPVEYVSDVTGGIPNGRFWNKMSAAEKASIVFGITLGAKLFEQAVYSVGTAAEKAFYEEVEKRMFNAPDSSAGEFAKEMSVLYEDPLNVVIPINEMYLTARRLFRGETTTKELQDELTELRKSYNSAH